MPVYVRKCVALGRFRRWKIALRARKMEARDVSLAVSINPILAMLPSETIFLAIAKHPVRIAGGQ